jgi:hypothetical protein
VQRLRPRHRWTAPANRWLPGDVLTPRRLGNALEQRLRLAFTDPPPQGHLVSTGAAALCPCYCFLSPLYPLTGALRTAAAPACRRLCRSYLFLWRLCRAPLGFLSTWASACYGEQGRSACICPSAIFPPSFQGFALYCRRAPASRSGPPGLRAGDHGSPALDVPGDRRAHARAGRAAGVGWRPAWWQRAPTPLAGRCAPL